MNANEVFPSKFLKAEDISQVPPVLTISEVLMESMPEGPQKPVLSFREVKKRMICNKTNWNSLTKFFGPETDDWVGQRVSLAVVDAEFKGDVFPSLRIKQPRQDAAAVARPLPGRLPTEDEIPF